MRSTAPERDELRQIFDDLSDVGWTVITGQEVDQYLPSSLDVRPDFIAIRGDEKLVGQVISAASPDKEGMLRQIERISSAIPEGWQFNVFYLGDVSPAPTVADVHEIATRVRAVITVSPQAALLLAWSGLEMSLHRLQARYPVPRQRSKIPSIAHLNSVGAISDRMHDKLSRYQHLRHQIAHRNPLLDVSESQVLDIVRIAQTLASPDYQPPEELTEWFNENCAPAHPGDTSTPPTHDLGGH